jgi:hypothetical protein
MRVDQVQPGLFRETLSDEERRAQFSVRPEVADALRGKPGSMPLLEAISHSFDLALKRTSEPKRRER